MERREVSVPFTATLPGEASEIPERSDILPEPTEKIKNVIVSKIRLGLWKLEQVAHLKLSI